MRSKVPELRPILVSHNAFLIESLVEKVHVRETGVSPTYAVVLRMATIVVLLFLTKKEPAITVDYDKSNIELFQHVLETFMNDTPLGQAPILGAALIQASEIRSRLRHRIIPRGLPPNTKLRQHHVVSYKSM